MEQILVDDRRRSHLHDLRIRLAFFFAPAPDVELVAADIGGARQNLVNRAKAPATSGPGTDASIIQEIGDLAHTHRARTAITMEGQLENEPHGFGLQRIDRQLALGTSASHFRGDHLVAEGRPRAAVPIPLPSILSHRSQGVLGVLFGLILIEQRHDLTHHHAHRIVAEVLGYRDQAHAVLSQLPDIEFELKLISEKAGKGVDDDKLERRRLLLCRVHHLLELGSPVIRRRRTRLDELRRDGPALTLAIGYRLSALIRDRQVVLGLTARRDAQIKGRGHRKIGGGIGKIIADLILGSGAHGRTSLACEQAVEDVAEMDIKNVKLCASDGNTHRPIVANPARNRAAVANLQAWSGRLKRRDAAEADGKIRQRLLGLDHRISIAPRCA